MDFSAQTILYLILRLLLIFVFCLLINEMWNVIMAGLSSVAQYFYISLGQIIITQED